MTDSKLKTITCPKCGHTAHQVVHAESRTRKGWYCKNCTEFTPAILRERHVK